MFPRRTRPEQDFEYSPLPTPHPPTGASAWSNNNMSAPGHRYMLADEYAPVSDYDPDAPLPSALRFSEVDLAVAQLEQRMSPMPQHHNEIASDTATLMYPEQTGTTLSDGSGSSKVTSATQSTAVASDRGRWGQKDAYTWHEYYKDTEHDKLQRQDVPFKQPWSRVGTPTNPFGDHALSAPIVAPAAVHYHNERSNASLSSFPHLEAAIRTVSNQTQPHPPNHDSFDHDPENYAPEGPANEFYTRPIYNPPRSRSPTPEEALRAPSVKPSVVAPKRTIIPAQEEVAPIVSRISGNRLETEKPAVQTVPSPIPESSTMHFGSPPKKQRRRNQGLKKIVPLTQ